jgi:hypothetical protein
MCGFCHDFTLCLLRGLNQKYTPKTFDNRFISQRFKNRCYTYLVPTGTMIYVRLSHIFATVLGTVASNIW